MRSVRHVGLGGRWKDRAGLSDLRRCGWTARVWCHACGLWCSTDLYLWCVVPLCLRRRSVQWRVPLATHPRGHTRETRTAVSSGERRRGVTQHACPSTEQRYLYRETHGETHISLIYYIIIILSQRYLYTSRYGLSSLPKSHAETCNRLRHKTRVSNTTVGRSRTSAPNHSTLRQAADSRLDGPYL